MTHERPAPRCRATYRQALARAILSRWWSEGKDSSPAAVSTSSTSGDDTATASETAASTNTGSDSGSSKALGVRVDDGAGVNRWQDLLTGDVTAIVPVERDVDCYRSAVAGRVRAPNRSDDRVNAAKGAQHGKAPAVSATAATVVAERVDAGMGDPEQTEAPVVPRFAERMLYGWEAVQAEAERMRVAREALGHPTAAGTLRLTVEVHVSVIIVLRSGLSRWGY